MKKRVFTILLTVLLLLSLSILSVGAEGRNTLYVSVLSNSEGQSTQYQVKLPSGQPGYNVKAVNGSVSPVEEGGSFSFTVKAKTNYEKGENFCVKVNGEEITPDENGVYTITNITADQTVKVTGMVKIPQISVTVPQNAKVEVSYKSSEAIKYYYQTVLTKLSIAKTVENADNTITYYYNEKKNVGHIYRVTTDDGVTYVGFFTKSNNVRVDLTVTDAQLHPLGKTAKTLERDLSSNNGYNVADVFLNINEKGYLSMNQGDTKQLYPLRNWQAIKDGSYMANAFVEPDYHYMVIDENGRESNSVVTVDKNGLLTAVGDGTAIVLVTYDAMTYEFSDGDEFFGAIWPENTGVFVVSVGVSDSGITTGITINTEEGKNYENSNLAGDALDAEMDVIYFVGNSGSYTFTPATEGVNISVANPTIGDTMAFNGFRTVSANSDGSYSVPLVEGRNIVRLEKDGKADYQVITAKAVTITVNDGKPVKPGDEIVITFTTIYHPANKLGGIYNGTAGVIYTDPDGKKVGSITDGSVGVYDIASSKSIQTITSYVDRTEQMSNWGTLDITYSLGSKLIIPEDYTGSTYTLDDGAVIAVSNAYCMKFGAHRTINGVDTTTATQAGLVSRESYFGQISDIVIQVSQPWDDAIAAIDAIGTVTLDSKDAIEAAETAYQGLTKEQKSMVANYDTLTAARKAYDKLVEDAENSNTPSTPVTPVVPSTPSKPSQTTTTVTKKNPFTDVAKGDWYYDAVQYAYENGLMNGTGSGVFSPNATTTRGMIVTILARMEGVSTDQGETWYDAGQKWAMELGISDGTNMEGSITREQLAAMLYRYAQLKGYDVSAKASLKGFADAEQVSDWAVDAMQWAVGCGLMQGDNNRLTPTATATRAQVATMLMRLEETF